MKRAVTALSLLALFAFVAGCQHAGGPARATARQQIHEFTPALDDALRKATSSMIDWLMAQYELTLREVSQVVGTSAEYKVSVVVGRNAGIVMKLHRIDCVRSSLAPSSPRIRP